METSTNAQMCGACSYRWPEQAKVPIPTETETAPRIICTQCPAVAKVHYFQPAAKDTDSQDTAWISCHGQHLWIRQYRQSAAPGVPKPGPFQPSNVGPILFENLEKGAAIPSSHLESRIRQGLTSTEVASITFEQSMNYFEESEYLFEDLDGLFAIAERQMMLWDKTHKRLYELMQKVRKKA